MDNYRVEILKTKPENYFYTKLAEKRRADSGIIGEKNAVNFVKDAGLEIIKENNFDPKIYSGQHGVDIIASETKYGKEGFYTQYHIFEVTNFKKSTHMHFRIMSEKIDNLLEAARQYPNAKIWLIPSYNKFDKRISARLHRLGITVLTMGRVHKVWHKSINIAYSHNMTFSHHHHQLRELRMIIKGIPSEAQAYTKEKVRSMRDRLGKHYPREFGLTDYFNGKLYEKMKKGKRLLNTVYKLQTALHKIGVQTEKIGTLLKGGLGLPTIIYRLQNMLKDGLQKIAHKELLRAKLLTNTTQKELLTITNDKTTIEQRNNVNSVCVKASYSELQVDFENKLCVGVFGCNTWVT